MTAMFGTRKLRASWIAVAVSAFMAQVQARPQSANVPEPPKADIPYLLSGDDLVQTEAAEATESHDGKKRKEETMYTVAGEHSKAKTPLASPIFVVKQDSLDVERLEIYRFDVVDGQRRVTFSAKKTVRPYTLTVTKTGEARYRMEVNESLPAGEYGITPSGSNQVFCFAVY